MARVLRSSRTQQAELAGSATMAPASYLERNRQVWDALAPQSTAQASKAWRARRLRWGLWNTPETELKLIDGLEPGSDVIELGCGAGAICAWLARSGMHPVGVDISTAQLGIAERFQLEFGVTFPLVNANAEQVPYDRHSFDLAISEYGASVWCDPGRWLPEAHRLLRPGGLLVFFRPATILLSCTPGDGGQPGTALERSYFSSGPCEFPGAGVEFHATHGEWVRLLRGAGFVVENLVETRPPARSKPRYQLASSEWASRWPSEEIWVARTVDADPTGGRDLLESAR